jgi:hypothetical protein
MKGTDDHENEIRFTNSTKTFLEECNSARHNRLSAFRLAWQSRCRVVWLFEVLV